MNTSGTEKLRQNLLSQQERLLQQLDDLVEVESDMDPEEYAESKADTLEQIIDVVGSLKKIADGDMTLTGQLESERQKTRTAISSDFHTIEVIQMFAKRDSDQLKLRLKEWERDFKLGKVANDTFQKDRKEMLMALRQLGEQLTVEQEQLLQVDQTDGLHYERVSENSDASSALEWAKKSGAASKLSKNINI